MRNDSADGRTVGAHSEAFSGGAYSRWACWTQANPDPSCAGSGTVDSQHRCAMAHAAAKLSELQNCASPLSNLVLQRDFASSFNGRCQRASRTKARWMKKNASSMRRSLWPKVAGQKSDQRSAEKA